MDKNKKLYTNIFQTEFNVGTLAEKKNVGIEIFFYSAYFSSYMMNPWIFYGFSSSSPSRYQLNWQRIFHNIARICNVKKMFSFEILSSACFREKFQYFWCL